jgi:hypothetical protein
MEGGLAARKSQFVHKLTFRFCEGSPFDRDVTATSSASTVPGFASAGVGGAQLASTDGYQRLASSHSEGAFAEREGFEPSAGF